MGFRRAAAGGQEALREPISITSSLPEVVGDAGVYFDPLDIDDMAQATYRGLESPDLRLELVGRGQIRSRQYGRGETAAATRHVYKEACGIKRRGLEV